MNNCPKCLESPCSCGWEYRHKKIGERIKLASVILGVSAIDVEKVLSGLAPDVHPALLQTVPTGYEFVTDLGHVIAESNFVTTDVSGGWEKAGKLRGGALLGKPYGDFQLQNLYVVKPVGGH